MRALLIIVLSLVALWQLSKYFPCPSWLAWMIEIENPLAIENRSGKIISHLELKPHMVVADIGCGPGRVTLPLAKELEQGRVVAIDLQEDMLKRAKEKLKDFSNVEFLKQNISEVPLEKNTFDRIILVNVIGETPNHKKSLEHIYKSLKDEGLVSLTETVFDSHFQSKSKLKNLLENQGYKNIRTFGPWWSYTIHGTK